SCQLLAVVLHLAASNGAVHPALCCHQHFGPKGPRRGALALHRQHESSVHPLAGQGLQLAEPFHCLFHTHRITSPLIYPCCLHVLGPWPPTAAPAAAAVHAAAGLRRSCTF